MATEDLSVIFEKEPEQWGLRGDRFMWLDMKEECAGREFPFHEYAIAEMVCRKFEDVSGVPLTYDARPYVEKYAHGGMSSGQLSGLFWIAKGIAQLIQNFHDAQKASDAGADEEASPQREQEAPEKPAEIVPGWVERFAAEFPEHRWTIQGLAAHGWTEHQLRSWLEKMKG